MTTELAFPGCPKGAVKPEGTCAAGTTVFEVTAAGVPLADEAVTSKL